MFILCRHKHKKNTLCKSICNPSTFNRWKHKEERSSLYLIHSAIHMSLTRGFFFKFGTYASTNLTLPSCSKSSLMRATFDLFFFACVKCLFELYCGWLTFRIRSHAGAMQWEALNRSTDSGMRSDWWGWGTPVTLTLPRELCAHVCCWRWCFPYNLTLHISWGDLHPQVRLQRPPAWCLEELWFLFPRVQDQERAYALKMIN